MEDRKGKEDRKAQAKGVEKKRKAASESELCRAIFPIYYLGKACGLVPVRLFANTCDGCVVRLNIVDLMYSLCVLGLLLGGAVWGLWRDLKDGWEHSTRLKSRTAGIATCSDVLGVTSLTVVCIVGSPFRWKYLQLVINKLMEVDKKIGVSSANRARRFTICLTACCLAYLWFNSILDFYTWSRKMRGTGKTTTGKGPVNYAPIYFMYTVIISTEIQYTVSTYNIGERFVRLNECLSRLLAANNDYLATRAQPVDRIVEKGTWNAGAERPLMFASYGLSAKLHERKTHANSISELITIHCTLCDVVSLVNSTFGMMILAVTVTCLLHLVITPYFLIIQAGEQHEWIFLVVQGGWCIFHIARMLIIVQPSYSAVAEGRRTAVLVSRLLSRTFETNARRELEVFSLQLLHRPLEFSACGLFSLDRTLITSIAGAVTTYLVILIQFQNADETKGDADIIRNASQILKKATPLQNLTALRIARTDTDGRRVTTYRVKDTLFA